MSNAKARRSACSGLRLPSRTGGGSAGSGHVVIVLRPSAGSRRAPRTACRGSRPASGRSIGGTVWRMGSRPPNRAESPDCMKPAPDTDPGEWERIAGTTGSRLSCRSPLRRGLSHLVRSRFCDAGGVRRRGGGRSPGRARLPDRHRLTLVSSAISMPNRLQEQSVIPPGQPNSSMAARKAPDWLARSDARHRKASATRCTGLRDGHTPRTPRLCLRRLCYTGRGCRLLCLPGVVDVDTVRVGSTWNSGRSGGVWAAC